MGEVTKNKKEEKETKEVEEKKNKSIYWKRKER